MSLSWKSLLGRTAAVSGLASVILALGVVVGVRVAKADPGGPTRDALTFSGVLRERAGMSTTLTFAFRQGSTTLPTCVATTEAFAVDGNGAFSVAVPLGGCADPRELFDGEGVVYDVFLGDTASGTPIVSRVNVTPVPYARFADQTGVSNDCPVGYERDRTATPGIVCRRVVTLGGVRLNDEVVKVGSGASAFWVDRYEASVHFIGTGVQLAVSNTTGGVDGLAIETSGLTMSGQRPAGNSPAWALSHPGQPTVNVTWFQANEACAASGKRLLQREEWFRAASGTVDGAMCNVSSPGARAAAAANGCVSASGAHDMIGNVWEWTGEWDASVGQVTSPAQSMAGARVNGIRVNDNLTPWPATYNGDGARNITSTVNNTVESQIGIPAAALRGGNWGEGALAGVFALALSDGPSAHIPTIGFRCIVPR